MKMVAVITELGKVVDRISFASKKQAREQLLASGYGEMRNWEVPTFYKHTVDDNNFGRVYTAELYKANDPMAQQQ